MNDDTTFKPESHSNVLVVDDTLAKSGNYQQAINDFNKAIELNPKYAEAYNNRGNVYNELRNSDMAIQNFKRAAQLGNKEAQEKLNSHGIKC